MASPSRNSKKPEVSPTNYASADQEKSENSSKNAYLSMKIDHIYEEKMADIAIAPNFPENQQNTEKNLQITVVERKKKYKPDQLLFIKTLLMVNFFGVVVILAHILFVFIRLLGISSTETSRKVQLYAMICLEILVNLAFITSWTLYFVSALKCKRFLLQRSKSLAFFSIFAKIASFVVYLSVFFENLAEDVAFLVISCVFLSFQLFSLWNYAYVSWKMSALPEKTWKKAFRRPKGKYMYAQD